MSLFNALLTWSRTHLLSKGDPNRKRLLIKTITIELIILAILLGVVDAYFNFWTLFYLLSWGIIVGLGNLILLKKNYSFLLCGHILNALILSLISVANLWLGGLSNSYVGWFYVSPLIASATIGIDGLFIYGILSASVFIFFISGYLPPLYIIQTEYLTFLNNINYIFIFLIILTTLYNLLRENKLYETLLEEQNYLLYADKQKFHYLSHHDSLTNLPNRAYFNHYLQNVIDATDTKINSLTLYFMDLDGFKKINDKYGHETGDILLLQASKRLQSCFREKDFISRLAGDEFTAVITHHTNDKIAEKLASRIETEFSQPFLIKGWEIECTISVGIANYPLDALHAEDLLKLADEAMYKHKKEKQRINQNNCTGS